MLLLVAASAVATHNATGSTVKANVKLVAAAEAAALLQQQLMRPFGLVFFELASFLF